MVNWLMRLVLILVFPLRNLIVLPWVIFLSLQDSFLPYMAQYGMLPNKFIECWKSCGKTVEETCQK